MFFSFLFHDFSTRAHLFSKLASAFREFCSKGFSPMFKWSFFFFRSFRDISRNLFSESLHFIDRLTYRYNFFNTIAQRVRGFLEPNKILVFRTNKVVSSKIIECVYFYVKTRFLRTGKYLSKAL